MNYKCVIRLLCIVFMNDAIIQDIIRVMSTFEFKNFSDYKFFNWTKNSQIEILQKHTSAKAEPQSSTIVATVLTTSINTQTYTEKAKSFKKSTTKKTTTKQTTTSNPTFDNWRDHVLPKDLHVMKAFTVLQLVIGLLFSIATSYLCLIMIAEMISFNLTSFICAVICLSCGLVLPHLIGPILGLVSFNYDIETLEDAIYSFNLYRSYAIITIINICTVISNLVI